MAEPLNQQTIWITMGIQIGFIAFFSVSQPIFTIYGFLINVFHIMALFSQMTSIYRRKPAEEKANIGVWKVIFHIMMYLALIINTAIIMFTNTAPARQTDALDRYLLDHGIENPIFFKFMVLVIFEHVILILISFIIIKANTMPKWLKFVYKQRDYKKSI